MFALLNIDKPAGWTSRDVVNRVAKLVKPHAAGHAGTLDPLATGVLVVCLGRATRLVEYVQSQPKRYVAEFLFGRRSDTEDVTGAVEELPAPPQPARAEIEALLPRFLGEIEQRPPVYSALKVSGQRAYDLARRGEAVELAPRRVRIDDLTLLEFEYPRWKLEIGCGGGTYVRSLGRDIALALGTSSVMATLRRTAIGPFRLEGAVPLDALTRENLPDHVLSPTLAVAHLPRVVVTPEQIERLAHGQTIEYAGSATPGELAAVDAAGRLHALLAPRGPRLRVVRYFPPS